MNFTNSHATRLCRPAHRQPRTSASKSSSLHALLALAVALAFLCIPGVTEAQTARGSIVGTVTDTSGAVIPDASITVTQLSTRLVFTTHANKSGYYVMTSLIAGNYSIEGRAPGFKAKIVQPVEVNVAIPTTVNVVLPVAGVKQTVTVSSTPDLVNTTSASLSQVVRHKAIEDLPLNGRNFLQLTLLSAGAEPVAPVSENVGVYKSSVNISGGRESSNQFTIDGISNNAGTFEGMNIPLSLDAIDEFTVQRNTLEAEYGYGTSQVNVVTRSGSNAFNGTVYEYLRNSVFDGRQYFDKKIPPLRQNQFGVSFGGPIRKDHTFFFGNYEGFRERRATTLLATLPTAQELSGNFTGQAPVIDPLTRTPFPNNIIPQNRISPLSQRIIALLPKLNTGGANNYSTAPSASTDNDQFTVRVDQDWGQNDRMFARYTLMNTRMALPGITEYSGSTVTDVAQNAAIEWTHVISPSMLNSARIGFDRDAHNTLQEGANGKDITDFKNIVTNPIINGLPTIGIAGFSSFGGFITYPDMLVDNLFQFDDSLTWVKGSHTFKFGAGFRHTLYPHTSGLFDRGDFVFQGTATGNPVADFLLGNPFVTLGAGRLPSTVLSISQFDAYAQDEWRLARRFTLDYGLRYERNSVPTDRYQGYLPVFDVKTGTIVTGANEQADGLINPDNLDFAPRIGFSWQPFQNSRTVVRAGYGIYYDVTTLNVLNVGLGIDLNWQQYVDINPLLGLPPAIQWDNLFPPPSAATSANAMLTPDPFARTPYVQQYSLSIQHQLPDDFVLETAYAGSVGHRLNNTLDINQATLPTYSGEPISARVPYPAYGSISMTENRGWSNYNALQVKLERRYSRNLYFLASYTYSKSLDTNSSAELDVPQNSQNLAAEYALSDFNQTQRFVTSVLYQLPFGRGQRFLTNLPAVGNALIGDWQLNTIYTYASGTPFSVEIASDGSLTGGTFQRANVTGPNNGNLPDDKRTPSHWFNTSAFSVAPLGTFGNSGRNILIGPPTNNVDFSMLKNFPIGEARSIQFRAEFFNLLNHPQFNLPIADPTSAAFGQVTSTRPAREIQLALRLNF